MKARVLKNKQDKYNVQYKRWKFGWWIYLSTTEYGYDGSSWNIKKKYDTKAKAVKAMAEFLLNHNKEVQHKNEVGVVFECSEDEVLEKLSEFIV